MQQITKVPAFTDFTTVSWPQSFDACVRAVEKGRMHVDCTDSDHRCLLFVVCQLKAYGVHCKDYIERLCTLRPSIVLFWTNVLSFRCTFVDGLPPYVWSDLNAVEDAMKKVRKQPHWVCNQVQERRAAQRWARLRPVWMKCCARK
jgi:hypothetical protein